MRHHTGFGLIQILIAAGILGFLTIVILRMSQNALETQKTFEIRSHLTETKLLVQSLMLSSNGCVNTVGPTGANINIDTPTSPREVGPPVIPAKYAIPTIKDGSNRDYFINGQAYFNGQLTLVRIELHDSNNVASLRPNPNPINGVMDLTMTFQYTGRKSILGTSLNQPFVKVVPISITADGTGAITRCAGTGTAAAHRDICENMFKGSYDAGTGMCQGIYVDGDIRARGDVIINDLPPP